MEGIEGRRDGVVCKAVVALRREGKSEWWVVM